MPVPPPIHAQLALMAPTGGCRQTIDRTEVSSPNTLWFKDAPYRAQESRS